MKRLRAGLYTAHLLHDGVRYSYSVERLTPDVSNEKGWSFAIGEGELSEPYPTWRAASVAARRTIIRSWDE